jgi:hypothetical protein
VDVGVQAAAVSQTLTFRAAAFSVEAWIDANQRSIASAALWSDAIRDVDAAHRRVLVLPSRS